MDAHGDLPHCPCAQAFLAFQATDKAYFVYVMQMVWFKAKAVMVFACSPILQTLEEAKYVVVILRSPRCIFLNINNFFLTYFNKF